MPRTITADDYVAFTDISPDGPKFTCISPAPSQGYRRCRNPVNRNDRDTASRLGKKIFSSITSRTFDLDDDDLREYAKLCCCVRYHRAMVVNEPLLNQLVLRWRTELVEQRQQYQIANRTPEPRPSRPFQPTATQRGPTRTTRSHAGTREDPVVIDDSPSTGPRFEPYRTNSRVPTLELISMPLTEQQQWNGHIYCCSRLSDPGFYKAGCTRSVNRRSLDQRVQKLQSCSGRDNTVTLEYSVQTEHAHRTEDLVHNELQEYRRRELHCLDHNCATRHREWFEVEVAVIKRVISRWAQWMNQAKPYDDQGRLRKPWKDFCSSLQREGTPITSSELYLAWLQGLVRDEDDDTDSVASYSSEEEDSPDDSADCPICLETMSEPVHTTCGHAFCSECIARVFETYNRCPMCRTELVDGELPAAGTAEIPMQNTTVVS